MSEATYIKKLYVSDDAGTQGAEDLAGPVRYEELAPELQGMIVDVKVKVSDSDQSEGKLINKLAAGESIELSILGQGADEKLEIGSKCNVAVSDSDSAPSKLSSKMEAGDNIGLAVHNAGADESLVVSGLGKCRVSSADSSSAYLDDKLTVGQYMKKTIDGSGADEQLNVEVVWTSVIHQGLGWANELINDPPQRMDERTFSVASSKLKPVSSSFTNIIYREDAAVEGAMGSLISIGTSRPMSEDDWTAVHGLNFLYVCNKNCWVNLRNDAAESDDYFRPLLTGNGQDINFVQRALFAYDNSGEAWQLLCYTKQSWAKCFTFGELAANEYVIVASELPVSGIYHFDIFCAVEELDEYGVTANVDAQQTLYAASISDGMQVDSSVNYERIAQLQSKVINSSLQGSGIIKVTYLDLAQRWIKINAQLPNGTTQRITGGYIHLFYLGESLNT